MRTREFVMRFSLTFMIMMSYIVTASALPQSGSWSPSVVKHVTAAGDATGFTIVADVQLPQLNLVTMSRSRESW
jgi:hypothetical protein